MNRPVPLAIALFFLAVPAGAADDVSWKAREDAAIHQQRTGFSVLNPHASYRPDAAVGDFGVETPSPPEREPLLEPPKTTLESRLLGAENSMTLRDPQPWTKPEAEPMAPYPAVLVEPAARPEPQPGPVLAEPIPDPEVATAPEAETPKRRGGGPFDWIGRRVNAAARSVNGAVTSVGRTVADSVNGAADSIF